MNRFNQFHIPPASSNTPFLEKPAERESEGVQEKISVKIKEYTLAQTHMLLSEYSNDIPAEMLDSTSSRSNFKVRRGWFQMIDTVLSPVKKYLPTDLKNRLAILRAEINEHTPGTERHITTKEEIDRGDAILKEAQEIVEKLETKDTPIKN